MPETLETTVDLAWHPACGIKKAVQHVVRGAPFGRHKQVFHRHQLGDGKTVVHLHQVELLARVGDAGLGIGALGSHAGGAHMAAVPLVSGRFHARADGELDRLDRDQVAFAHGACDLGRGHDGRRRPVADTTAVEQAQRFGNHRRVEYLLHRHCLLQMRLGAARTILVALPRHVGNGALQGFLRDAMLAAIPRSQLRKSGGRRTHGHPEVVEGPLVAGRQAAIARVLELFGTDGQRNVHRARGHGIDRAPQGLGARGAHVLHAAYRNAVQAQGHGSGNGGVADVHRVQRRAVPGGIDLLAFYACIGEGLLESLCQQLRRACVPAFAKTRAAHAENGYLVLDTCCHSVCS